MDYCSAKVGTCRATPGWEAMGMATLRIAYLVLVSTLALLVMSAPAGAAWPGSNGRIVYRALKPGFEAEGQGALGLAWTTGQPGDAPHALTADPTDADPQVSPDGRSIAFARQVDPQQPGAAAHSAVFILGFDESGARQLTEPPEECWDGKPTFDFKGERLFFIRHCRGSARGTATWSVKVDGGDLRKLEGRRARSGASVISPTGRQVVFIRRLGDGQHLISMRPDGSRKRDLSSRLSGEKRVESPDFSPNGRVIVFSTGTSGDLFTIRSNGRNPRQLSDLTHKPGHDPPGYTDSAFSPAGDEVVAVAQGHSGPDSLVRFEVGGDGRARGVPGVRYGDMPVWAPLPF